MGDLCESLKAFLSNRGRGHAKLSRSEFAEGGEEAVDFFGGVVVDEADAKHAALGFDAEAFAEIEGVVVAVPGEDAAFAEEGGDGGGMVIAEAQGEGGATFGGALRVGNAIDARAGNGLQPGDQPPDDFGFVGDGRVISGGEGFATRF